MRGEKVRMGSSTTAKEGSPPHARGKGKLLLILNHSKRITPACAGKSKKQAREKMGKQDHPRMRGEKLYKRGFQRGGQGSPPHARGKVRRAGVDGRRMGITPACAGKRRMEAISCLSKKDHPRMRGEKGIARQDDANVAGSPPHARGKARKASRISPAVRITPACAGKSETGTNPAETVKDHPRMRGEKPSWASLPLRCRGSPPHARGKDNVEENRMKSRRITPACAGKSKVVW